ncbi:RNI-like protein [Sistotremastrum suecicum HHB10207 ss-3]|uniref:RNI-like protein n=1 Tax=Sistotremastrum suecicum HHB10207 ss-3 TaxID=1314776 RepID=A0A166CHL6_9AGAM|nr:RNI-like protein [Sistotremastrum suecicum HHB10207 ss-3]
MNPGTFSTALPSKSHIVLHDTGLRGVTGAQTVINVLSKSRTVKILVLGHNPLGDEGIVKLFAYLCSDVGRKLNIEEISLNATSLGDVGLNAVSRYITRNHFLKGLHVQNNFISGSVETIAAFTAALNSSRVEIVNLTHNFPFSDIALDHFLSSLDAPHLRELHLSCLSLTPVSGPVISDYLSSRRSAALKRLKLNGNQLDLECLKSITKALDSGPCLLEALEMFANSVPNRSEKAECDKRLHAILRRNMYLNGAVSNEALALLPVARCLLLPSASSSAGSVWRLLSPRPVRPFHFRGLPIELQYHILSCLAPNLSARQAIRIFNYASSPATLPSLELGLAFPDTHPCVSDPTATMMSGVPACSGDPRTCLGPGKSLICGREEKRTWWLERVGCDRYELNDTGQA